MLIIMNLNCVKLTNDSKLWFSCGYNGFKNMTFEKQ